MRLASETAHGAFALSSYPSPVPPCLACGQPASEAACRLHCRCAVCVIEQHTRVRAVVWVRNTCALGLAVCVGETGPRGAFVLPHLGALCSPGPSSAPWLQESGHQRPCSHSLTLCLCRHPPAHLASPQPGGQDARGTWLPPPPTGCPQAAGQEGVMAPWPGRLPQLSQGRGVRGLLSEEGVGVQPSSAGTSSPHFWGPAVQRSGGGASISRGMNVGFITGIWQPESLAAPLRCSSDRGGSSWRPRVGAVGGGAGRAPPLPHR